MPAVTPADVRTLPSATKIGSGSTSTCGKRRASSSHHAQCVVTRRPSSRPARGEQERPRADGGDAPRARRGGGDPADQLVVGERGARALAARDEQRVDRAADLASVSSGTIA